MTFRREPALIVGLVTAAAQLLIAFLGTLSDEEQAVVNAAAAAVGGLLVAALVVREQLAPAVLGFAKAALSLAVGFGLELSPEQQSLVMAFVTIAVAMFVRTQVVAPPADQHA